MTLKDCIYNPHVDFSLFSTSRVEKDGWSFTQGDGQAFLQRSDVRLQLWRSGGLYILGGGGGGGAPSYSMAVCQTAAAVEAF